MSRFKTHKHSQAQVITVDRNFLPMQEIARHKAMTAIATGRAQALDLRTWAKLGLSDLAGMKVQVIVYPKAKAVSDLRLGFGRGNRAILRRDEFVCQYKGCNCKAVTVDHVVPRCQGGKSTWGNLVGCCRHCNEKKGGRTPEQAGMELKNPVRSPRYHLLEQFRVLVESNAA